VALVTLLALAAASVRVLPWLLDPRVPWRVAVPFGRAVASVAVEAAVLVGWPVGWALATFALIERGEARVLALLGERPARTVRRLVPWTLAFGALLAGASLSGGRDASEPGRVLSELLDAGLRSCRSKSMDQALEVPLLGAEWLCVPGVSGGARLAGRPPFARGSDTVYSARAVTVSPDARHIELEDAWVATPFTRLHVGHAVLSLPPFVRASSLPASWRALLLFASAAASSLLAGLLLLVMEQHAFSLWRFHAFCIGSAGPLACLALLHALELARGPVSLGLFALLPLAAAAAVLATAALVSTLPGVRVAATR
jgi:hypothetical protein